MPISLFPESGTRPLRLAVLGSGGGSNLTALIESQSSYEIVAVLSDRPCGCQTIAATHSIPHRIVIPSDEELITALHPFEPDLVFLAGYMRLVGPSFLAAYPSRVLNVHPADLTKLDANGARKYVGLGAVRKAIEAGESTTRSSVILVDESVDGGPLLVSGPWASYSGTTPPTREEVSAHQELQKKLSDWPAAVKAVQLISDGRVTIDSRTIYLDSSPLGNAGYDLSKKERLCAG